MGHYSNSFNIKRVTRHGCLLSPSISAIAIKSLAIAIRSHPDIRGVRCGQEEHKCALFADKMLSFLTSANIYPACLNLALSRLTKSIALNISVQVKLVGQLKQHFPFTWAVDTIPYLGKNLTNNIGNFNKANYLCSANMREN